MHLGSLLLDPPLVLAVQVFVAVTRKDPGWQIVSSVVSHYLVNAAPLEDAVPGALQAVAKAPLAMVAPVW